MQDIGNENGITKERVRQLMAKYNLPRLKRKPRHRSPPPNKYETLDEYFAGENKRKKDTRALSRFLSYIECAECGSKINLHKHYIRYPALSLDDVQILCASCHRIKHRKGLTYEKQLLLHFDYSNGVSSKELAVKYCISRAFVYRIIKKIKMGHRTTRGK